MRKITLTIFILTISSIQLFPQWSNDPNNNLIIGFGLDPHICSDSAGGCYVTYDYGTTSYPRKLALERLDKYGYKPWGDKKQILGELPEQWHAEIIEDGEGGVIVGFEDNEWIPPYNFTTRVRVQRVDSSGNFSWGQTGVRVTTEQTNHGLGGLVSDGEGGCIIVWQDYDGKYWINLINSFGQRVWTDSGKVLGISAYSERPRIIRAADGNYFAETGEYIYRIRQNGEIMLWESTIEWGLIVATPDGGGILHSSIWNPSFYKLLAQRKDTLGNNLWQEPYVEVADSVNINARLQIKYNNGYYYYGWYGIKNGIEKVTQFQALRLDGSKLYPNGSLTIGEPPYVGAAILPLEPNKTALIYSDSPDLLLVQTYDTLGNKLWNENGVLISHSSIGAQSYTTDGNSGFILIGTIEQFTIVAQQVNKYGQLGEVITGVHSEEDNTIPTETVLYQNYPNPFNSSTTFEYKLKEEGRVVLNLYNILGEKIQTLYKGEQGRGLHQISITLNELPSGVYFFTLETADVIQVRKLTILK